MREKDLGPSAGGPGVRTFVVLVLSPQEPSEWPGQTQEAEGRFQFTDSESRMCPEDLAR